MVEEKLGTTLDFTSCFYSVEDALLSIRKTPQFQELLNSTSNLYGQPSKQHTCQDLVEEFLMQPIPSRETMSKLAEKIRNECESREWETELLGLCPSDLLYNNMWMDLTTGYIVLLFENGQSSSNLQQIFVHASPEQIVQVFQTLLYKACEFCRLDETKKAGRNGRAVFDAIVSFMNSEHFERMLSTIEVPVFESVVSSIVKVLMLPCTCSFSSPWHLFVKSQLQDCHGKWLQRIFACSRSPMQVSLYMIHSGFVSFLKQGLVYVHKHKNAYDIAHMAEVLSLMCILLNSPQGRYSIIQPDRNSSWTFEGGIFIFGQPEVEELDEKSSFFSDQVAELPNSNNLYRIPCSYSTESSQDSSIKAAQLVDILFDVIANKFPNRFPKSCATTVLHLKRECRKTLVRLARLNNSNWLAPHLNRFAADISNVSPDDVALITESVFSNHAFSSIITAIFTPHVVDTMLNILQGRFPQVCLPLLMTPYQHVFPCFQRIHVLPMQVLASLSFCEYLMNDPDRYSECLENSIVELMSFPPTDESRMAFGNICLFPTSLPILERFHVVEFIIEGYWSHQETPSREFFMSCMDGLLSSSFVSSILESHLNLFKQYPKPVLIQLCAATSSFVAMQHTEDFMSLVRTCCEVLDEPFETEYSECIKVCLDFYVKSEYLTESNSRLRANVLGMLSDDLTGTCEDAPFWLCNILHRVFPSPDSDIAKAVYDKLSANELSLASICGRVSRQLGQHGRLACILRNVSLGPLISCCLSCNWHASDIYFQLYLYCHGLDPAIFAIGVLVSVESELQHTFLNSNSLHTSISQRKPMQEPQMRMIFETCGISDDLIKRFFSTLDN